MADMEFNLLSEPWIRVMGEDCAVKEVSLTDALLYAHEYKGLAGELPTQDAAALRLLLAVLHAVFGRVDINGEESEIENPDNALDRWENLWQNGRFPEKPLTDYLESQHDRFWLFHPERPFWQVPQATLGTEYDASKLNGALSESSNKLRLFAERAGAEKNRLTYSEAARWLLYINAFDDTSAKPTKAGKAANGGKLPSPGAGWLGKIGYVAVTGSNLFEELMLNFVLLDWKDEPWASCVPVWELESPRIGERTEIQCPHDQAKLLTLQSRRLFLHRDNDYVTGYHLLGGDFFDKVDAFPEQMTVWSRIKDKGAAPESRQPRRHDSSRQMWRDFALYAQNDSDARRPGVITWNLTLQKYGILPKNKMLHLSIASLQYGDKDFFAADVFSDSLSIHLNLLSDVGERWRTHIVSEIERCDKIAGFIGSLASDLFVAAGGDTEKKAQPAAQAREQYYYAIDVPFRKWLAGIDADDSAEKAHELISSWRKSAEKIAYRLADQMQRDAGPQAFVGKTIQTGKSESSKRYYSTSTAMGWFRFNMRNLDK